MNFKKTIAKSLVVAMALGMVPVANLQTAKAAAANLTFSGAEGIAKSTDAKFWGIAKEDKKAGKDSVVISGKHYKITNIQELEGEIDLYAALKGKAGILAVGVKATPDTDWTILELPAAENTFKVYYSASTGAVKGLKPTKALGGDYGYLFASKGKKAKEVNLKEDQEKIEVKLNDGSWSTLKEFFGGDLETGNGKNVNKKLKVLGQSGSSLSFRIKGTDKAWASKESKVKIAVQAKAPNVKIDVNKDTTSIKKGMEYQVVEKGGAVGDWKESTAQKGLSMLALSLVANKDQDVLVRTAASAKKIASKYTRITLNKPAAKLNMPTGDGFVATGKAIDKVAVVESELAYDITKGATLKNISKDNLEYALVKDGTAADKIKWNTLKASKDPVKKPSKAKLKFSATPKDNTWSSDKKTKLFLRVAGVKQNKNGVATQAGVSAGSIMALTNIAQVFKFMANPTTDNAEQSAIELGTGAVTTTASIKIVTGAAAKFTIKANVSNVVKVGAKPKVKLVDGPKVSVKAGKVDASGNFDITVVVNKNLFKADADIAGKTTNFNFELEGVKSGFKLTFAKKTA